MDDLQQVSPEDARIKAYYEADFKPDGGIAAENRIATALSYTAYQLGQINRKMDRLIEAIEKTA